MPIGSVNKIISSRSRKIQPVIVNELISPVTIVGDPIDISPSTTPIEPVVSVEHNTSPELVITEVQFDTSSFPDVNILPKNITVTGASTAEAGYKLLPSGSSQQFNGIEWINIDYEWLIRGSPEEYEIRLTYRKFEQKGNYSFSGKIGSWIDISNPVEWISYAKGPNSSLNVTLYLEIRKKGEKINVTSTLITLAANTTD